MIRFASGGNIDSSKQVTQTDRDMVPASVAADFYDRRGSLPILFQLIIFIDFE